MGQNTTPGPARRALVSLNITIVGAGIGGLAAAYLLGRAGHHVTVLESAPTLSELGAGIQITPNMTRLFLRWGLGSKLKAVAVVPKALSLRRCKSPTAATVGFISGF
jgi:salicylate hydroxylase